MLCDGQQHRIILYALLGNCFAVVSESLRQAGLDQPFAEKLLPLTGAKAFQITGNSSRPLFACQRLPVGFQIFQRSINCCLRRAVRHLKLLPVMRLRAVHGFGNVSKQRHELGDNQ